MSTGRKIELTLRPAAPGTGIVFSRVDLPTPVDIPAAATSIGDTRLASVLQKDGVRVSTVEHLMSACAGSRYRQPYVDVTAEEIPIMDGSAATFVFLIQSAGIEEQNAPKRFVKVKKTVEIRDGDKFARLDPYFGFKLKFRSIPSPGRRQDRPVSRSISPIRRTCARLRTHVRLRT